MTKREARILLAVGGIAILGFAGFIGHYSCSIQAANGSGLEGACDELVAQQFTGHVVDIETYDYDSFMHDRFFSILILINDTTKEYVNYQFDLKRNRDMLEYASVGQTAIKEEGAITFLLIDSAGELRQFQIAKCAAIDRGHEP
ncbi:MAG: hypothetical protein KDB95_04620 [Flavobacteriales bacterium]|nr:hypothetical protein [Flavobacteriales bacterium]